MNKNISKTEKFINFNNVNETHIGSFHELSYDKENDFFLVESEKSAYNFDLIHKEFSKKNKCQTTPTSDSIYCSEDKYYFIEFKNTSGTKDNFPKSLLKKMIGTYLNFNDLLISEGCTKGNYESLNFYRVFVMVHSKQKYEKYIKNKEEKNNDVQRNTVIRNRTDANSLQEEMKIFTNPFLGYLYDEIHIIDDNSFDTNFISRLN